MLLSDRLLPSRSPSERWYRTPAIVGGIPCSHSSRGCSRASSSRRGEQRATRAAGGESRSLDDPRITTGHSPLSLHGCDTRRPFRDASLKLVHSPFTKDRRSPETPKLPPVQHYDVLESET